MGNKTDIQPIEVTNLNERVYEILRERILNCEFAPGERLDLSQLEEALQVSMTPLKNALTRLQTEGLVEIQPRRGTYVAPVSPERIEEAYKIRSAFELYVALCLFKYLQPEDYVYFQELSFEMDALVCDSGRDWQAIYPQYLEIDRRLHERFVERGGTPRMLRIFQQMNVHMQMQWVVPHFHDQDFEAVHFEHGQLFDALADRSPERLSAALLNHLEASRIRAMKRLGEREPQPQE